MKTKLISLKNTFSPKNVETKLAIVASIATVSASSHAALDQAVVDTVVAAILSDWAIALAAGFAIFAVVKAGKVGFGLLAGMLSKGARS